MALTRACRTLACVLTLATLLCAPACTGQWAALLSCNRSVAAARNAGEYYADDASAHGVPGGYWHTRPSAQEQVLSVHDVALPVSSSFAVFMRYRVVEWGTFHDIWLLASSKARDVFQLQRSGEATRYTDFWSPGSRITGSAIDGGSAIDNPWAGVWTSVMVHWQQATGTYTVSWRFECAAACGACAAACMRSGSRTATGSAPPPRGPYTVRVGGGKSGVGYANLHVSHLYWSNASDATWPTEAQMRCPAPPRAASNTRCPSLCRAPAGFEVDASGDSIQRCAGNHFHNGSAKTCSPCPAPGTFSSAGGLTDVSQCACRAGHQRVAGVCTACPRGFYKAAAGDAPCAPCEGEHTTRLQGAVDASACVCPLGYASVDGACELLSCPAGSVLDEHTGSCKCSAGFAYVGPGQSCAACADGLFKDSVGNAPCASCGANTASLAPRANRTACRCAAFYEPGLHDGPDVAGGSCVAECPAGRSGRQGVCSLCESGQFKAGRGAVCSACPGPRRAAARGNADAAKCSCPQSTLEVDPQDMLVVDRLGPFIDESAESVTAQGALLSEQNSSRSLWRLSIENPATAGAPISVTISVTVSVGGRLVFLCAPGSCAPGLTTIDLQGMRGLVNATFGASAHDDDDDDDDLLHAMRPTFSLSWRTRREVVLRDSAQGLGDGAQAWWPAAEAQAQAWAAAGRLRPGAAVFRTASVFSSAVVACAPCPAQVRCAAYVV